MRPALDQAELAAEALCMDALAEVLAIGVLGDQPFDDRGGDFRRRGPPNVFKRAVAAEALAEDLRRTSSFCGLGTCSRGAAGCSRSGCTKGCFGYTS